ncbi:ABC transporter ATP-binding protein [Vagococcus silagei]|uniref:ABC transporter ATP-binding protein n=1 Tax=Vagococcus silagei TaxID=2508885 RepID=A0A4S3B0U5_9ENTE|nr:ABC transporter ATP-binding protein [Vagococcus silagei]THB60392.1 ABC transporter ATP-binding protein [Vagococcus silagei]
MNKAIDVFDLSKKYGSHFALKDLNLSINEGEFFGLIGPNGAGKSTLIRILLNMIFATSGEAAIFNLDCAKESAEIKKMTSYVSSDVSYYDSMKVKDIFRLVAKFHHVVDFNQQMAYYTELFDLQLNKKFRELSLGNKRKVAIICGLLPQPKLLILDEPTNGLDPLIQFRLFEILEEKNKQGMTIILSSHDLKEVQTHCEKAAFIKEGKIIAEEKLKESHLKEKVLVLYGNDLPKESFENQGCRLLQSDMNSLTFHVQHDVRQLFPLFYDERIIDFTIRPQELEDKFLSLYVKGEN